MKTYKIDTCVHCDSTASPTTQYGELCCSTCGAEWDCYTEEYTHEELFGDK